MPPAPTTRRNPWLWIPTLYMAEGLPYVVVMTVSVIMYKNLGLSNTDIAIYTSWLYLPFVIKPLWSPVVDLLRTRRQWVWVMELIVGAGLAGVALTIPAPDFLRWTLVFFWLLAFSGATHDIAADGFYLLGTTEREQAFFIGIRGGFFNLSKIASQGLLVMLAGAIQTQTGLGKLELHVTAQPGAAVIARFEGASAPQMATTPLRFEASSTNLTLSPMPRAASETQVILDAAKDWNIRHGFTTVSGSSGSASGPSWWGRNVSQPLGEWLRRNFGQSNATAAQTTNATAGNVGIAFLRISAQPPRAVTTTLWLASGDKSIGLAEGARLQFTAQNWQQPAALVFQLDPKLHEASAAVYEVRSGNIVLSWIICFALLAGLMVLFGCYHLFVLPRPATDRPGQADSLGHFIAEFFRTFGAFFRKEGIGSVLCFLLLYRFAESQLVKMSVPFLLDPRETGGLGLTTGEVGLVYGTVGIIALMCGGVLGGIAISRHGLRAWLWPMACLIQLPNTVYVYLAYAQPTDLTTINVCVAAEQLGYGFGFAAYMFFMICGARGPHATAHFAICTGFMALGMMLPGMWSGWLQEALGYQRFFLWVMIATIPGFAVVKLVRVDAGFGKKQATT